MPNVVVYLRLHKHPSSHSGNRPWLHDVTDHKLTLQGQLITNNTVQQQYSSCALLVSLSLHAQCFVATS